MVGTGSIGRAIGRTLGAVGMKVSMMGRTAREGGRAGAAPDPRTRRSPVAFAPVIHGIFESIRFGRVLFVEVAEGPPPGRPCPPVAAPAPPCAPPRSTVA